MSFGSNGATWRWWAALACAAVAAVAAGLSWSGMLAGGAVGASALAAAQGISAALSPGGGNLTHILTLLMLGAFAVAALTTLRARHRALTTAEAKRRLALQAAHAAEMAEKNRELERRNRELRELFFVFSHDLKNPLVSIAGFSTRLRRDLEKGELGRAERLLESIARNAAVMNDVIDGATQLGDMEDMTLKRRRIRIADLLKDVRASLAKDFETAQARIMLTANCEIVADRRLLIRALQNMVQNALRYGCPAPGMEIEVLVATEGDAARIGVRDSGPGVDPRLHERIFTLYQRVEAGKPGRGIGLAIVRRVARLHGGDAWVDSDGGLGATFWIGLGGASSAEHKPPEPEPERGQAA